MPIRTDIVIDTCNNFLKSCKKESKEIRKKSLRIFIDDFRHNEKKHKKYKYFKKINKNLSTLQLARCLYRMSDDYSEINFNISIRESDMFFYRYYYKGVADFVDAKEGYYKRDIIIEVKKLMEMAKYSSDEIIFISKEDFDLIKEYIRKTKKTKTKSIQLFKRSLNIEV